MNPPNETLSAPPGFTDYLVRYYYPGRTVRTQVYRATSLAEAEALVANATAPGGRWYGWTPLSMVALP